jgi:hypothetical protein
MDYTHWVFLASRIASDLWGAAASSRFRPGRAQKAPHVMSAVGYRRVTERLAGQQQFLLGVSGAIAVRSRHHRTLIDE